MRHRDRRRHRRHPASRLRFNSVSVSGSVRNLSRCGLAIETFAGLRVGERYTLSLRSMGRSVRIRGTVRWCTLESTRRIASGEVLPVFVAGITLLEP